MGSTTLRFLTLLMLCTVGAVAAQAQTFSSPTTGITNRTSEYRSERQIRTPRQLIADLLEGLGDNDTATVLGMGTPREVFMATMIPAIYSADQATGFTGSDYDRMWRHSRRRLVIAKQIAMGNLWGMRPRLFTMEMGPASPHKGGGVLYEKVEAAARLASSDHRETRFDIAIAQDGGSYSIVELGPISMR